MADFGIEPTIFKNIFFSMVYLKSGFFSGHHMTASGILDTNMMCKKLVLKSCLSTYCPVHI